ncbi:uncharacterized protein TNCV_4662521 [Trichonephila clavipes]|uniref:Uncharacterized protein n=1 Tax=Trichonephila clavipes TaxID=2585209 RepID=A0A8X6SB95_TRICX|nr:uncharacterized protein TNCV_4662521 [Trichonephila clavipes]
MKRLQRCRDHLNWTQLQWEQVIWSDEYSITLFLTITRVFVWLTPAEAFHIDCLVPTVKHGGGSIMVWGVISFLGSQTTIIEAFSLIIFTLCFRLSFRECVMCSLMTKPLFTRLAALHEHDEWEHLKWCPQSPDLNIIECSLDLLENKVCAEFPPHILSELKMAVHGECAVI